MPRCWRCKKKKTQRLSHRNRPQSYIDHSIIILTSIYRHRSSNSPTPHHQIRQVHHRSSLIFPNRHFQSCPLKYKYRYLLQIPAKPHHSLSFGRTMHTTLYQFHQYQMQGKYYLLETYSSFTIKISSTMAMKARSTRNNDIKPVKLLLQIIIQNSKKCWAPLNCWNKNSPS